MTDEQIFDLAESYADWDDFGRWTFRDADKLIGFVLAIQKSEREKLAKGMANRGYETGSAETIEELLLTLDCQVAENWIAAYDGGREKEREECAKVCEENSNMFGDSALIGVCLTNAKRIRARGEA